MKKVWIYSLTLFLLITCFTGCYQNTVTPTDLNDNSTMKVEEKVITNDNMQDSSFQTVSEDDIISNTVDEHPAKKTISFASWDIINRDEYSWTVSATAKESPTVLCRSLADLSAYLNNNALPAEYASKYSDEYFKNNSLLLFYGFESCQGDLWLINNVRALGNNLQVDLEYHAISVTTIVSARVYCVELGDRLEQIQTIEKNIKQFDGDGKVTKERTEMIQL